MPQDGSPWALYAEDSQGKQHAQGTKCEACFDLWNDAFKHMEWEQLEKKAKEKDFAALLASARKLKDGDETVDAAEDTCVQR
eukprot:6492006-Amphidinium_carterae.1